MIPPATHTVDYKIEVDQQSSHHSPSEQLKKI